MANADEGGLEPCTMQSQFNAIHRAPGTSVTFVDTHPHPLQATFLPSLPSSHPFALLHWTSWIQSSKKLGDAKSQAIWDEQIQSAAFDGLYKF